jgi:hypothetical protein
MSSILPPQYMVEENKKENTIENFAQDNPKDKFEKKSKIEFSSREFIKPFSVAQKSGNGEIFDIITENDNKKSLTNI